ncbi:MAG: radical SAM/CxCxxxxC motif protein YfkAB [Firmicutes bacterium]|nr:radical SAM/CxCxxxxC motif protein YfkAB [Bacillota bacterium]
MKLVLAHQDELQRRLATLRETPISPENDPWDPYATVGLADKPLLTSIEVTVTNLCNLRCEHCAVGDVLTDTEQRAFPLDDLMARLDEVDTLVTFSVTGGEPAASQRLVDEVTRPLLQYAKARGLRTQVNTNLTLPLERYESFIDLVDVLHVSYNYPEPAEFARIAYAYSDRVPKDPTALLRRMERNIRELSAAGRFVSAETILTRATLPRIEEIHARIAELGCRRHEIHPLYPSDFAARMSVPALEEYADGVRRLLATRNPEVWILFGTFPFFACSPDPTHRQLLAHVLAQPNTTVRNDPDGRNRLNVSSLTGDVLVADFASLGPVGNIGREGFQAIWERWLASQTAARIHCHCPAARCLGPNIIVAETYFPGVDWHAREAAMGAGRGLVRPT